MESLVNHLLSTIQEDFHNKFKNTVSDIIQKKLAFMGIHFNNESEFLKFAENRITRVLDEGRTVFYVDYIDDQNCGALLASFANEPDYSWNENHTMITAELKIFG